MTLAAQFYLKRDEFILDASFAAPSTGITVLFGPSGCGKTTLLRCIAGLERVADGFVKLGDTLWQNNKEYVPVHRRALSYVFQEANLFPHLSVQRNLEYGFRRVPVGERLLDFDEAVELLGVGHLLDRSPAYLSGGERQRVAIARALLAGPRLLLMDEPLAALDRQSKAEILPFLERLHKQLSIPIIYISHVLEEVTRLADHLLLMQAGKVIASGPADELFTRLDLPLAHADEAEAIIEAVVAKHDEACHLTYLDFPGGRFTVPREDLSAGQVVRVRLRARDISLTLERQTDTSILNIFPANITVLQQQTPSQMLVQLEAQGAPLLARITRKSAAALRLAPGKQVYVQVKSVALLA